MWSRHSAHLFLQNRQDDDRIGCRANGAVLKTVAQLLERAGVVPVVSRGVETICLKGLKATSGILSSGLFNPSLRRRG